MSITDGLRAWARDHMAFTFETLNGEHVLASGTVEALIGIADRIDAEHDAAIKAFGAKVDSDYDSTAPDQFKGVLMTDSERIAYIVGWLQGFEPMVWTFVGEKMADETASEYARLVYELGKLLGIKREGA